MKNQKGFTLIELLLVLAIIGIISAIAIPALLGQRERAKMTATKDNSVSITADLVSTLAELSDPPSQRKTGYATTLWTADATGYKAKADEAVRLVMLKTNFANAKNPYDSTSLCYTVGAAVVSTANAGKVFLDTTTAGATDPVITCTGVWKDSKGTAQPIAKTVPVD